VVTIVRPRYPARRRLSVATVPRGHRPPAAPRAPPRNGRALRDTPKPPTPATSPAPTTWTSVAVPQPAARRGGRLRPGWADPRGRTRGGDAPDRAHELRAAERGRSCSTGTRASRARRRNTALGVNELRAVAVGGRLVADHRVHEAKSRHDLAGRLVGLRQGEGTRHRTARAGTRPRSTSSLALHADARLVGDGLVGRWRRQRTVVAAMEGCAEVADGEWGRRRGPEGAPGQGRHRRSGRSSRRAGRLGSSGRRPWPGPIPAPPHHRRPGCPRPAVAADDGHDRASAQPSPSVSEPGDAARGKRRSASAVVWLGESAAAKPRHGAVVRGCPGDARRWVRPAAPARPATSPRRWAGRGVALSTVTRPVTLMRPPTAVRDCGPPRLGGNSRAELRDVGPRSNLNLSLVPNARSASAETVRASVHPGMCRSRGRSRLTLDRTPAEASHYRRWRPLDPTLEPRLSGGWAALLFAAGPGPLVDV
jgi:hypothetical protein